MKWLETTRGKRNSGNPAPWSAQPKWALPKASSSQADEQEKLTAAGAARKSWTRSRPLQNVTEDSLALEGTQFVLSKQMEGKTRSCRIPQRRGREQQNAEFKFIRTFNFAPPMARRVVQPGGGRRRSGTTGIGRGMFLVLREASSRRAWPIPAGPQREDPRAPWGKINPCAGRTATFVLGATMTDAVQDRIPDLRDGTEEAPGGIEGPSRVDEDDAGLRVSLGQGRGDHRPPRGGQKFVDTSMIDPRRSSTARGGRAARREPVADAVRPERR